MTGVYRDPSFTSFSHFGPPPFEPTGTAGDLPTGPTLGETAPVEDHQGTCR